MEALLIVEMAKRGMEVRGDSPAEDSDLMKITPLGSGQEVVLTRLIFPSSGCEIYPTLKVGRSCHIVQFKDKKIMLDCGIHPGLTGMDALPFVDMIEADQVCKFLPYCT